MRVGVLGAGGRMGAAVCRAVADDPGLDLVAAVDPGGAEEPGSLAAVGRPGVAITADVADLAKAGAEVAVDFTVAAAAHRNMSWCAANGVHAVVGTTGIGPADVEDLRRRFLEGEANCVMAPNFAIGAVLMMRFAELAAPFMDGAEIVELHHQAKVDAPSGTALATAEAMTASRRRSGRPQWSSVAPSGAPSPAARGDRSEDGVPVHSVRLPGLVAHQEVVLGAAGQSLTIRHDAYDRSSFMPGVLLAIRAVPTRRGLTTSLTDLLGI